MDPTTAPHKARRRETSDSRTERKRELDRLAQRATRERTKNRIAFLEQKLASLESCDRQGEISNLTKIIDNLRNDNMRLQSAMLKMKFAINEALDGAEGASAQQDSLRPCGCSSSANCSCQVNGTSTSPEGDTVRHDSISTADSEVIDLPPEAIQQVPPDPTSIPPMTQMQPVTNGISTEMSSLEEFFGINGAVSIPLMNTVYHMPNPDFMQPWQQSMSSPFDYRMPIPATNARTIAQDVEKWHVSNGAFINCMDSVRSKQASNASLNLHVPFRAAIFGWDSVGDDANHPVWAALRRVDQEVFGTWTNIAQRIALMYVCQTLLQYRENPTKENLERVPIWFRPRPAQEKIQHPAVIDFLIWPGMRDRLVFEHEKYTRTGDFSAAFVNNFNFHWPYTEREIYTFNPMSQAYEVSKFFLEYAYDFRNWTMKSDFFKKFPEMQHDVPSFGAMEFNHQIWT